MSKAKAGSSKIKKLVGTAVVLVGIASAATYVVVKVAQNGEPYKPRKTKTDPTNKS